MVKVIEHNNGHARNGHAVPSEIPSRADGTAKPGERDHGGKFARGNQAGKQFGKGQVQARGNPHYRRMAELRQKVLEVMTPERLKELIESLLNRAMGGDAACAKLVLSYCLGKAPAPVDPDAQNLHEWGLVSAWPTAAAVAASVLDCVPPLPAVDTVRTTSGIRTSTVDQVLEKLHGSTSDKVGVSFMEEVQFEKAARRQRGPRA